MVISREANAPSHAQKKQSGRIAHLSPPTPFSALWAKAWFWKCAPRPGLRGSLAFSVVYSPAGRRRCEPVGGVSHELCHRRLRRRGAAAGWSARGTSPGPVDPGPSESPAWSGPGLDARHGGYCGRNAHISGGAETAAERAADPGVRTGILGAVPSSLYCCPGIGGWWVSLCLSLNEGFWVSSCQLRRASRSLKVKLSPVVASATPTPTDSLVSLGSFLEIQGLSSTPDLGNQNLYFNKIPRSQMHIKIWGTVM